MVYRRTYRRRYNNYRSKYSRYNKRKYYRRKKRAYKPYVKKISTPSGVPDIIRTKLKYAENKVLSDAVGGITTIQQYRGNSIYDPDLTGTGNQPMGHDQWAAFYSRYKVNACKINVQFLPRSNLAGAGNILVAIIPTVLYTAVSSLTAIEIIQQPYVRYTYLTQGDGGKNSARLSSYMTTKKMFGLTNTDEDEYSASFGANPVNDWYFTIVALSADESSTMNVQCMVQLTYYTEFKERIVLSQS